jgi:hypothetical protein
MHSDSLYSVRMSSTYKRDFPEFKARLAARVTRQRIGMVRLADSLRESLTAEQRAGVVAALGSGDAKPITDLSISQHNALFVLLAANEPETLVGYLKGEL